MDSSPNMFANPALKMEDKLMHFKKTLVKDAIVFLLLHTLFHPEMHPANNDNKLFPTLFFSCINACPGSLSAENGDNKFVH